MHNNLHLRMPPPIPPPPPHQLPRRDVEKLACLVLYLGGRMQQRLDAAVTHLVTMETTGVSPGMCVAVLVVMISTPCRPSMSVLSATLWKS